MYKNILPGILLALLLLQCSSLLAQHGLHCAYDQAVHMQTELHPAYKAAADKAFEKAKNNVLARSGKTADEETLRIPIVVHLLHNTPEQEISDDLVHSQIEALNLHFNRLSADTANTREIFLPLATSANIEFYLADVDPDGEPTNGIVRKEVDNYYWADLLTALQPGGLDAIKSSAQGGSDPWDTERYCNIWVGNMALDIFGTETPGALGFAYPPVETTIFPAETFPPNVEDADGLVIDYRAFGVNNPIAETIDMGNGNTLADTNWDGKTCVHEMGHYLGLRHIWGDGGNPLLGTPGTCEEDDFIDDTPRATSNGAQVCDLSKDTCPDEEVLPGIDTAAAYPDMVENYMDYSSESCQNMFTAQQVALMREMITLYREGLLGEEINVNNENLEAKAIALYPNPSQGIFTIDLGDQKSGSLQVIDPAGKVLQEMQVNQARLQVNLSKQADGVYLILFNNEDIKESKRLVLMR